MAKQKSEKLTLKHLIGYGAGDCGGVVTLAMVGGFMARFLQVNLEVNAGVLATMLLIWNIWDAVNDPMMGTIMDIVHSKHDGKGDKFRPWILWSIPILTIGCISFFVVPPLMGGGVKMLVAAFILKIVYEGGYTMMNIAMGSLLGSMATNDQERASLASARGFGSTIGGLLYGMVIPQVLAKVGTDNKGYAYASVVAAIIGAILVFIHYALTEERNLENNIEKTEEEKEAEKFKMSDILNIVKSNRAFLALILHSVCICAVQALGQGAGTYMYMDVLHNVGIMSYTTVLSTICMISILSAAPLLAKKWDLVVIIRTCLMIGFFLYGGLLAYCLLVGQLNAWVFAIWNALAGAMITMSVQMQWGLVAETIDYNEYLTGKRNEGTIYGFFSFSRRLGTTIASSLSVLLIAGIGYDAELTNAGLEQSAATILGIKLMVVGFPLIAAVGSWACFTFIWNINKDVRAKMAAWKEERLARATATEETAE